MPRTRRLIWRSLVVTLSPVMRLWRSLVPRRMRRLVLALALVGAGAGILALTAGSDAASRGRSVSSHHVLPRGAAWYSESLDTSPGTALNHSHARSHTLLQKWMIWQNAEYERTTLPGHPTFPGGYEWGDDEPGFGDWDAQRVYTLPDTESGVMALLRSGRLEAGQSDPAERTSPLIWLAQLATMLVDDAQSSASRAAGLAAIEHLPGLRELGPVKDPEGRPGIAVAEQAADLHPLQILTGPHCHNPDGGRGCRRLATPSGEYQLELILDPQRQHVLAIRTTALAPIPAALIKAGQPLYVVSFLQSRLVRHPRIPPLPPPMHPSVQSVPWRLAKLAGSTITVHWSSGSCAGPPLRPRPRLVINEANDSVTATVLVHVVKDNGGGCAGVALAGSLHGTLRHALGSRHLNHGAVTDPAS